MFDEEARNEKRIKKIISKGAQMAALAVGLILLSFMLPALNETETTKAMQSIFMKTGLWLFLYAVVVFLAFGLMRQNILLINAVMQFIFLPSVGIIFVIEMYHIFTD